MKSRTFLGFLLAINAGLAAALVWQVRYSAPPSVVLPPEDHAERVRLEGESPARVVDARPPESSAVKPKASSVAQQRPAETAHVASAAHASSAQAKAVAEAPAPKVEKVCMRWGDFTNEQWQSARVQLQRRLGKLTIDERLNEDKAKYWVHIPPRDDIESARQAIANLKEKGVTDSFIIQDGSPQQFAVSLGLFSKKTMADTFLNHLRAKGVSNAVSRPHPQSRYLSALVQGIPADRVDTMQSLAAGFEKTTLQAAKCPPKD